MSAKNISSTASSYDYYIVLCETEHGKRYWRGTADPDAVSAYRRRVIGPALVGAGGYPAEQSAVDAIELNAGGDFDLNDPDTWIFDAD